MGIKSKIILLAIMLSILSSCRTSQIPQSSSENNAKREFRGAWIQTAFQSEYQTMTPEQMKADFIRKLDYLQQCGINAIIFQVRPEADAFYKSDIEPWSRFFTGKQGVAPKDDFDLMAFLIPECHKRNMEFHAWINPYRAATAWNQGLASTHIYYQHPEWFVTYNKQLLFNPGLPECRQFICRVVKDIVSRYDVDAIHADDYFYPYPVAGLPFPDSVAFEKYGFTNGFKENQLNDWRRYNVNKLIEELKETIIVTKPWVRLGISPFGIYRNRKSTPDGSGSETNGLQNYDDLYADILLWEQKGWIDYVMPQIYWEIGHPAADYATLIRWWNNNAFNTPLYVGQDVARTMKAGQLTAKMELEHSMQNVSGHCWWPANEILWNNKGVADSLKMHYHRYPALIPPYSRLHNRAPKEVSSLKAEWTPEGYSLHWQAKQSKDNPELANYFVVYRFAAGELTNISDPSKIVAITRNCTYSLPYEHGQLRWRYIVTAVDRFHNESKGKGKNVKL